MSALAIPAVCAGVSFSMPGILIGVSLPMSSTCGGRPGEKIRSDILSDTESIICTTCEKLIVDIGRESSRRFAYNGRQPRAVFCSCDHHLSNAGWSGRGRLAMHRFRKPACTQGSLMLNSRLSTVQLYALSDSLGLPSQWMQTAPILKAAGHRNL